MKWIKEISYNEQGSALATVVVIAVIISLFIGAILSGIILQSRFIQKDINSSKALYAAEEGLYRFLHTKQETGRYSTRQKIVLANAKEAEIHSSLFGGFLRVHSTGQVNNQKRSIEVLVGEESPWIFENAIVLGDSTSALTLTGTTSTEGNILVAEGGVKIENFKGVPYTGIMESDFKPFEGDTSFPSLNIDHFRLQEEHFSTLFREGNLERFLSSYRGARNNPGVLFPDTLYYPESIEWSSNDEVRFPNELVIVVDGNFTINGEYTFSPFSKIIVSDTLLVGGATAGKNVLLYAGKSLQIGGGASLSAQVMSQGVISVRDNAYLEYPSLVYSSKELYSGGEQEVIHIRGQALVDGMVIYPVERSDFTRDLFRVKVDKSAVVRGGLYNKGQTELAGTVYGSAITHQFYFYESPTNYINWLKDATINVNQRPDNFVIPFGFSDTTNYAILDWYEITD